MIMEFTVTQASLISGLPRATIRNMCKDKRLTHRYLGATIQRELELDITRLPIVIEEPLHVIRNLQEKIHYRHKK